MSAAERAIADVGRFAADPAQRTPVTNGWVLRYGLLYLGQNISWAAPTQLLLAQQILVWHPGDKEQKLALLMAIGERQKALAEEVQPLAQGQALRRAGRIRLLGGFDHSRT